MHRPDDDDLAVGRGTGHRGLDDARHTDSVEDDRGVVVVGIGRPRLDGLIEPGLAPIGLARVEHHVGPHGGGDGPAHRREVRDDDRLGQGGQRGVEAVRHGEERVGAEQHLLAVAAGVGVVEARGHPAPIGQGQERLGGHDSVGPNAFDARAGFEHPDRELVTHDHVLIGIEVEGGPADLAGHLRELTPMVDGVEIGPADLTGNGLDQHLPRDRTQVVDLVDDHPPLPQHRSSHDHQPRCRSASFGAECSAGWRAWDRATRRLTGPWSPVRG